MFLSPSMLERVYVRGSLRNTPEGFQFQLKNTVDHGTLSGVKGLSVDGADLPVESLALETAAGVKNAAEIGPRSPLTLPYSATVTVRVSGQPLAGGAHALVLIITVYEAGAIQLKFNDSVTAG